MDGEGRYVRTWKTQVSVGELYRWVLSKLSDKDIKRALHKYRDLMPRQSDWNRKLTQATNVPELGFRYLYRCGQIDETNHRTMQKMLKYIDRQDVLPYFESILYNTNCSNCSVEELQKALIDKVDVFLQASTAMNEEEVHQNPSYEVIQCQPLDVRRMTRSQHKRRCSEGNLYCITTIKRSRRSSISQSSDGTCESFSESALSHAYSATKAITLNGRAVQTILNSSLSNMLAVLQACISQSPTDGAGGSSIPAGISNTPLALLQVAFMSNQSRLLSSLPSLMSLVRTPIPTSISPPMRVFQAFRTDSVGNQPPTQLLATLANGSNSNSSAAANIEAAHRRLLLIGGVGVTMSQPDICFRYYARVRLRIKIDLADAHKILPGTSSDRNDSLARQLDIFMQTATLMRSRSNLEYVCSLRFNRLDQLEAFWDDYVTGRLKQMLIGALLNPDKYSMVGLGSWTVGSPDSSGNAAVSSPSRSHSRRGRSSRQRPSTSPAAPTGASSGTDVRVAELQKTVLAIRRYLFANAVSDTGINGPFHFAFQHMAVNNPIVIPPLLQPNLQNLQNPQAFDGSNEPAAHPGNGRPPWQPQPPHPEDGFDLFCFVSTREYNNARLLLMRNERAIPTLNKIFNYTHYVNKSH